MYRNGRDRRGYDRGNDSFKTLLIVTGSVLALAVVTFFITYSIYSNKVKSNADEIFDTTKLASLGNNLATESASTEIGKSINEVKNENKASNNTINNILSSANISNTIKETNTVSNVKNEIKENTTSTNVTNTVVEKPVTKEKTEEKKEEPKKDPTFSNPVEGKVIREFAKDNLVYSQTLDEWIIHLGIDIEADKTTVVKAAAEGTVETIKNDPRYGLTVVILHDNGFKTVYSNLLTAEFVTEGEKVKAGQTLGTVGNNASFELADNPHLHFEIIKNNERVDPKIYIK